MEEDSISTGLEWENLALYTARPMHLGFSSSLDHDDTHTTSVAFLSSKYQPPPPPPPPSSSASTSHMIGLRLGDPFPPRTSIPVSSTPAKRSRASYHNMQNPCCQVEGCNLDLKLAKDYHRRHRICEAHSKSPKVVVAGMERRFCQQCSRFHDLSEFDDKKRSCRRRLSDHNARRRRVQPDSALLTSAALSHSSYADHRQQNVLLNGLPISLSNPRWENANTPISRNNSLIRPSKPLNFSSPISNLHMDPTSNSRILDQCASTNHPSMAAPDLISAHSLLSSNPWSFNEGKSEPDPHHFTLFQSSIGLEQGPPHQEEYQLFKDPYDSSTFYSTQRSL